MYMEKLVDQLKAKQQELENYILDEETLPLAERKCLILYKEGNNLLKKSIEKLKDSLLYKD